MKQIDIEYIFSILGTVAFAFSYAFIEYYTQLWDLYLPFPKFYIWVFSSYQLFYMLPTLLLIVWLPFLDNIFELFGKRAYKRTLETFVLGIANLMLLALTEDIFYFLPYRVYLPRPNDPLGYCWIQPSDWTCRVAGYITISGTVIPVWYIIAVVILLVLYWMVFSGFFLKISYLIRRWRRRGRRKLINLLRVNVNGVLHV